MGDGVLLFKQYAHGYEDALVCVRAATRSRRIAAPDAAARLTASARPLLWLARARRFCSAVPYLIGTRPRVTSARYHDTRLRPALPHSWGSTRRRPAAVTPMVVGWLPPDSLPAGLRRKGPLCPLCPRCVPRPRLCARPCGTPAMVVWRR